MASSERGRVMIETIFRHKWLYDQEHEKRATQVTLGISRLLQLKRELNTALELTGIRPSRVCGLKVILAHPDMDPNTIIVGIG